MAFTLRWQSELEPDSTPSDQLPSSNWEVLRTQFGVARLRPFLDPPTRAAVDFLTKRALALDPTFQPPDLGTLAVIDLETPSILNAFVNPVSPMEHLFRPVAHSLARTQLLGPPPSPPNDPGFARQTYLGPADTLPGIGAANAWDHGGRGAGCRCVAIDQSHPVDADLPLFPLPSYVTGVPKDPSFHATQVMGILAARHGNQMGIAGIAPDASYRFGSPWRNINQRPSAATIAQDLLQIAPTMHPGDVLLLELQDISNLPLEITPAFNESIRLIVGSGITVVETAGNGGLNLNSRPFPDSGSILVAASTSENTRLTISNFGTRINCFALGESVIALPFDPAHPNDHPIAATSAAAAIVAGAAISLQGMCRAKTGGGHLSPSRLREIFKKTGKPPALAESKPIGRKPDLDAARAALP